MMKKSTMKLIAISDTHGMHELIKLPKGDILIHAGDITRTGNLKELIEFNTWLGTLDYNHKLVIAGNHDFCIEEDVDKAREVLANAIFLHDEEVVINEVKFYGSPWQPEFFDWAFNLPRGEPLKKKWDLIPEDTDVLITHGPPLGHGDETVVGDRAGCEDLLNRIKVIKPKAHVFGHIHEGQGITLEGETRCINASSVDFHYNYAYDPIEIEI